MPKWSQPNLTKRVTAIYSSRLLLEIYKSSADWGSHMRKSTNLHCINAVL